MKFFKLFLADPIIWPLLFALSFCMSVVAASADVLPGNAARNEKTNWISAADPRLRYEGRFDFSDSNAPVVIWQASRISLDFSSDSVRLLFDDAKGQSFFNVEVDGSNTVVELSEGKAVPPATLSGLGAGRHHLTMFKRSEAVVGTVR